MAHFVIATAFNKGIVMCKQHHEKFTVKQFAELIKENVLKTLNPSSGLFLQDSDPRHVSRAVKNAMKEAGCQMFAISVRSPHLNAIKNMFHLIIKRFTKIHLSIKLIKETFEKFVDPVKMIIKVISVEMIDKTTKSMNKSFKKS